MNPHPAHHMSIFGRSLFALLLFFFGRLEVKPREYGAGIVRAVLQSRKINDDSITLNLCEMLRNEAYRRANCVSQPLLWGKYLPALYEVANSAADYLKGCVISDARVAQILELDRVKRKTSDQS